MRRSKTERAGHIKAWRASGLSRPAYCREQGLKYATFMSWFKKEKTQKESGKFIALPAIQQKQELLIELPNGIRLHYKGRLTKDLLELLKHA